MKFTIVNATAQDLVLHCGGVDCEGPHVADAARADPGGSGCCSRLLLPGAAALHPQRHCCQELFGVQQRCRQSRQDWRCVCVCVHARACVCNYIRVCLFDEE